MASIAASVSVGGPAYAAAKGGMRSYTPHAAVELAPEKRVNCVLPGFMRTPMSTGERYGLSVEEQARRKEEFAAQSPMNRAGEPEDIAKAIPVLCVRRLRDRPGTRRRRRSPCPELTLRAADDRTMAKCARVLPTGLFGVRGRTRALDGAEADALYSLTSWPDY
jgi:short-subunit dehydrogenase